MAGKPGQKSGGHSTAGLAGRKPGEDSIRNGKNIKLREKTLEKLDKITGKTWDDKINYLLDKERGSDTIPRHD